MRTMSVMLDVMATSFKSFPLVFAVLQRFTVSTPVNTGHECKKAVLLRHQKWLQPHRPTSSQIWLSVEHKRNDRISGISYGHVAEAKLDI